jgi:type II secretory pathway pseudopilin PulG
MARRARPERSRRREGGFTFLWLIFALAVAAAGLAAIAQPISLAAQRDREAELMFRGDQIAHALSSYWAATPGDVKQLPLALADLVEDRRGPKPLRHLRRIYADPFTGSPDWVLVTDDDGRITAVHSRSTAAALRVVDLPRSSDAAAVPVSARLFRFVPVAPASSASAPEPSPSSALRAPPNAGSAPSP